ncbi:hypothetical protein WJX74_006522 [Apatococcus lobatus]|uniref:Lipid desaturase domain-containing protein n=1 Tax=Apatococcus lobatus TaxID=904363 RepID=A0AAW1QWW0_9CHLO
MLSIQLPQLSCGRAAAQRPSQTCRARSAPVAVSSSQQEQGKVRQSSSKSRPGPPEEDYRSSPGQQAIVAGAAILFAALELRGLSQINSLLAALQCASAAFAGYIIADFASGVYHWGMDNYGDDGTPFLAAKLWGFKHIINVPAHHPILHFLVEHISVDPCPVGASSAALVAMSQQLHGWAHTRKSDLPVAVIALQENAWGPPQSAFSRPLLHCERLAESHPGCARFRSGLLPQAGAFCSQPHWC